MPTTKRRHVRAPSESVIPKELLAAEVARALRERGITQTEASWIIQDAPSQISLVVTGKLRGISVDRLVRMITRLGRDVDIVIRPAASAKGRVKVLRKS